MIRMLQKNPCTLKELGAQNKDLAALRTLGFVLETRKQHGNTYYFLPSKSGAEVYKYSDGNGDITFGEMADPHAGCKQFNRSGLEYFLGKCVSEKVRHVHIYGDLTDGNGHVYHGQLNNLETWLEEEQARILADVLSQYPLTYEAVKGNHDLSHELAGGIPVGKIIAGMMDNFVYIDNVVGDLLINGKILKRMIHLGFGQAYAKSYPGQVYIRNLLDADRGHVDVGNRHYRIRMVGIGHLHTEICYQTAGIYVTHPGSFQGPTDYTVRRGLVGPMGGRITKLKVSGSEIEEFDSRFVLCR